MKPHEIIAQLVQELTPLSDADLLARIESLPALADASDPCWDAESYWNETAYPYLAAAEAAGARHLRAAVPLLLDRACDGDPGEIMRGLRHDLERMVDGDWSALADYCVEAARSPRVGTRLWAMEELSVLRDPRARPLFEEAMRTGPDSLRDVAEIGLERLG